MAVYWLIISLAGTTFGCANLHLIYVLRFIRICINSPGEMGGSQLGDKNKSECNVYLSYLIGTHQMKCS
jgi:hypothetical protein